MDKKVVVKQNPDAPVEKEVLAEAIMSISSALKKLSENGINRKAIVILLRHSTHLHQHQVERVLDSLESMKRDYCK